MPVFTYFSGARVPDSAASPATMNRTHTITAHLDVPVGGAGGVLVAGGGASGGFSFFVENGRPVYDYNFLGLQRTRIAGTEPLKPGANLVRVEFLYDGGGIGKGATVSLFVNDRKVGEGRLAVTQWMVKYSFDETFDIGQDTGTPASEFYASPSRFTGTIKMVVIDSQPAKLTAPDHQRIRDAQRAAAIAMQ